jgi:hypothetical protein
MEELLQAEEEEGRGKKKENLSTPQILNVHGLKKLQTRERKTRLNSKSVARGKRRGSVVAWYTRLREERDEVGLWRGKRGYGRKERNGVALFVWRCKRGCAATTKRRRCRGKNSKPVYMVFLCTRRVESAHFANHVDMLISIILCGLAK